MARARNIKPAFFQNEVLTEVDAWGRLLFIGLWTEADREGRLEDRPRRIKMQLFAADDIDVDHYLDRLHHLGFILRYAVGEQRYIQVINFKEWAGVQENDRLSPSIWRRIRRVVFERDSYICQYCGEHTEKPHCDHVVPHSRGGSDDLSNLVTACPACNMSKHARTPEEWLG